MDEWLDAASAVMEFSACHSSIASVGAAREASGAACGAGLGAGAIAFALGDGGSAPALEAASAGHPAPASTEFGRLGIASALGAAALGVASALGAASESDGGSSPIDSRKLLQEGPPIRPCAHKVLQEEPPGVKLLGAGRCLKSLPGNASNRDNALGVGVDSSLLIVEIGVGVASSDRWRFLLASSSPIVAERFGSGFAVLGS